MAFGYFSNIWLKTAHGYADQYLYFECFPINTVTNNALKFLPNHLEESLTFYIFFDILYQYICRLEPIYVSN